MPWVRFNMDTKKGEAVPQEALPGYLHLNEETEERKAAARNGNLHAARAEKNDEFYTRLEDIEAELMHYRKHFKGKVVLCNCDDPEWSNFFRFFGMNFDFLGLKRLVATHFEPNGKSYALIVDKNVDVNGDGKINLADTVKVDLEGHGDFRDEECVEYLKQADIVCTNVPFSLARDFLAVMKKYKKKFLFIGNVNMITYKEYFSEIKANRMWLGCTAINKNVWFRVPHLEEYRKATKGHFKIENGEWYRKLRTICWFTNLTHEKRSKPLDLVGNTYSPEKYPKYDNYNAIEVSKVSAIPEDYKGVMGLPITFLNKYCPEQVEILGLMSGATGDNLINGNDGKPKFAVNGKEVYARILIKLKPQKKAKAKK